MEDGENQQSLPHIEKFAREHSEDVKYLTGEVLKNKGVVLVAPVHAGKTSLAVSSIQEILTIKNEKRIGAFFTTPAQQEAPFALPTKDRTGISFQKLPSVQQLETYDEVVIMIDEISKRGPDPMRIANWNEYLKLPNAHFIFLGHPGSTANQKWLDLLPKEQVKMISFEEEKAAA